MNRSDLIFHVIALIILAIVFIILWSFTAVTSDVESGISSDELVMNTLSIIYGHLYQMIPICCGVILFSLAVAFYLEEWVPHKSWQYRIMERKIAILASIPSLAYGLLWIYLLVVQSDRITYLTLNIIVVLLVIPHTIQSTQTAIQRVDISAREAVYALGANRWRVITSHVLPYAIPMILGGILTVISRVLAFAAITIVVYEWKVSVSNSISSFGISNNVVILLSFALMFSIFSSLVEKNSGISQINLNRIF